MIIAFDDVSGIAVSGNIPFTSIAEEEEGDELLDSTAERFPEAVMIYYPLEQMHRAITPGAVTVVLETAEDLVEEV